MGKATVTDEDLRAALAKLASFGFEPREAVTAEDVAYQQGSAGLLEALLVMERPSQLDGDDPEPLFPRVFEFDYEFVDHDEAYEDFLHWASTAAGTADRVSDVVNDIGLEDGADVGRFAYRVDGRHREYEVENNGDWGDGDVVEGIFEAVSPPGHRPVRFGDAVAWVSEQHEIAFSRALTT